MTSSASGTAPQGAGGRSSGVVTRRAGFGASGAAATVFSAAAVRFGRFPLRFPLNGRKPPG
jgi:hypothetical protein